MFNRCKIALVLTLFPLYATRSPSVFRRNKIDISKVDLVLQGTAVQSCFCFIIVAAAIVVGIGALFLLFVLLYSQRVASQSRETLGELLHHPTFQRLKYFFVCLFVLTRQFYCLTKVCMVVLLSYKVIHKN